MLVSNPCLVQANPSGISRAYHALIKITLCRAIIFGFLVALLQLYPGKAIALWLADQWASIHSRNELALDEFTMLCSCTRHLTLTMPHSSNNISFGGLGGTYTCKNKTPVFNCEHHFHFHIFCLFYFYKRFFLVRPRRKLAILLRIRATFRPYRADVTANSNTLDVFQYKTNNNKDGRSYT